MELMPIESAPKDGTAILTFRNGLMAVVEFIPEYKGYYIVNGEGPKLT